MCLSVCDVCCIIVSTGKFDNARFSFWRLLSVSVWCVYVFRCVVNMYKYCVLVLFMLMYGNENFVLFLVFAMLRVFIANETRVVEFIFVDVDVDVEVFLWVFFCVCWICVFCIVLYFLKLFWFFFSSLFAFEFGILIVARNRASVFWFFLFFCIIVFMYFIVLIFFNYIFVMGFFVYNYDRNVVGDYFA